MPESAAPAAATVSPPRVWVMMGHKAGDNSQILALAEALGWPFEIKRLTYRPTELLTNLLAPLTLLGIVRRRSSPLAPPWPDLIISAGRRNEPPCRWIQARAGKRVRLVHCGRPWAALEPRAGAAAPGRGSSGRRRRPAGERDRRQQRLSGWLTLRCRRARRRRPQPRPRRASG